MLRVDDFAVQDDENNTPLPASFLSSADKYGRATLSIHAEPARSSRRRERASEPASASEPKAKPEARARERAAGARRRTGVAGIPGGRPPGPARGAVFATRVGRAGRVRAPKAPRRRAGRPAGLRALWQGG